ncbi:MAG TPA: hypothetical protein EYO58_11615, partial [Flavobacteriales bacterium]|nr:hypothetical protein [Flavobacteriales bacterium]
NVIFDIQENHKVQIKQITILGNNYFPDADLKAIIETREGNELSWLSGSGTYKEEAFQTDMMRLQAYYLDHGFIQVKVGQPTVEMTPDKRYIFVTFRITEGEQFRIGKMSFSGQVELVDKKSNVLVDEDILRKELTIKPGQLFSRSMLFQQIQQLALTYKDYGYAFVNITPNSQIHPAQRFVDFDMHVERGPLVYFNRAMPKHVIKYCAVNWPLLKVSATARRLYR